MQYFFLHCLCIMLIFKSSTHKFFFPPHAARQKKDELLFCSLFHRVLVKPLYIFIKLFHPPHPPCNAATPQDM